MKLLVLFGGLGAFCGGIVCHIVASWWQVRSYRRVTIVITSLLFVLMVKSVPGFIAQAAFCLLCLGLVALTLIDLQTYRLPREISYSTLGLGAPMLTMSAVASGEPSRIWGLILGALAALTVTGFLHLASRGALGDGDVRMSPLLGAYLGWLDPLSVVHGLMLSFTLGAIAGVLLMIMTKADRRTALPFGPFLAMGTLMAIVLPPPMLTVLSGGW